MSTCWVTLGVDCDWWCLRLNVLSSKMFLFLKPPGGVFFSLWAAEPGDLICAGVLRPPIIWCCCSGSFFFLGFAEEYFHSLVSSLSRWKVAVCSNSIRTNENMCQYHSSDTSSLCWFTTVLFNACFYCSTTLLQCCVIQYLSCSFTEYWLVL